MVVTCCKAYCISSMALGYGHERRTGFKNEAVKAKQLSNLTADERACEIKFLA